jgi:hypothetical protein
LFETSTEVSGGLEAFQGYEQKNETAWQ